MFGKRFWYRTCAAVVGVGMVTTVPLMLAQPPAPMPAAPMAEVTSEPTETPGDLLGQAPVEDVAFAAYFDPIRFGGAWFALDATALTDSGLGLAEGERVLLRTHNSGITAAKVLKLCVKLAVETKDKAALERLSQVAVNRKDNDLIAMTDGAKKIIGQARDSDPASKFAFDDLTESQFEAIKGAIDQIRQVKIMGDAEAVSNVELGFAGKDFGAGKAYVEKQLADAKEAAKESNRDVGEGDTAIKDALSLLTAESRGSNRDSVRASVEAGGWQVVYGVELNEGEYAKFIAAVAASVISANPAFVAQYFQDYLSRTYDKFKAKLPGVLKDAFIKTAVQAMKNRGQTFNIGKVGIRGGIATYNNWQDVVYNEPRTRSKQECKTVFGKKICITVPEVYYVKVTKKVPLPNKHQPFFAFRLY